MNIHVSKPFDADAYCRMQAERRKRLMSPQNAFKPSPVLPKPEPVKRAVRRPMWQRTPIRFDAHILLWQWHVSTEMASRYTAYIKQRCSEIGADYDVIMSKSTVRSITGPRQLLMYEVKVKFDLSYPTVGRLFKRDHTSVMSAVRRISAILGEDIPAPQTAEMRLMADLELKAKVKRAYEVDRLALEAISDRFCIPRTAITAVAKTENWTRPDPNIIFVKVRVDTRICMADVRRDYERGDSFNRIGIRYGISDKSVRRLADRNGWERKKAE